MENERGDMKEKNLEGRHMKKRLLGVQGQGWERKGGTDQQQQITCENVLMESVTLYANLIVLKGEAEGLGRHRIG